MSGIELLQRIRDDGIEMEVIILAWYILVTTESALALAIFGALRFGGTLLSPLIGSVADKLSRKRMLVAFRAGFALLALVLMLRSRPIVQGPRSTLYLVWKSLPSTAGW